MMLTFRPLRWYDCAFVYRLASEPHARAMSLSPALPTRLRHLRHFWRDLTRATHKEWIIKMGRRRAGLVCLDLRGRESVIGINLHSRARGQGIGPQAITYATRWALWNWSPAVVAEIKPQNEASKRAFLRAGYVVAGYPDRLVRMEYRGDDANRAA